MKRSKWPSVSYVIATFNSARTIHRCLASVERQVYPGHTEIVIADGGSTDETLDIARRFGCRIVSVPTEKQNAEYNKGVGVNAAKNDLLVLIDHDNKLPHTNWTKRMVAPLVENPDCMGTGVLRFAYDPSMTALDRYVALFGAADPVAFFLNKSAHQSYLFDGFHLRASVRKETDDYVAVELDPDHMPSLGGNGAVVSRKLLLRHAQADPDHFFHIDVHVDLAKKGYTNYAFVKDAIIHYTNNTVIKFLLRRKYYIDKYYYADTSKRRYSVYDKNYDTGLLMVYIVYSLTVIGPLYHSLRGFMKIHDPAWFIHPLMCIAMVFFYGTSTIVSLLNPHESKT